MEIQRNDWERWRSDDVTRELFKILEERKLKIALLLAEGGALMPIEREVAVGRYKEIEDLLNMTFEDTKREE